MYKIFIRYISTSNKTYWYEHTAPLENGVMAEFSTTDLGVLKKEIEKLDKEIGFSNIRVVDDITYSVNVDVADIPNTNLDIATSEDVKNIYTTAFNNVFGGGQ